MGRFATIVTIAATVALSSGLLGWSPAAGAPPASATGTWRQVSAGSNHTCALKSTGRVYCWGSDAAGQLGNGGASSDATTPVEVAGGATDWVSVSAGTYYTCGLKSSGRIFCWGSDFYSQLGNGGANTDVGAPVEVAGAATDWTSISAGTEHACARKSSGRIFCWGNDGSGRLGNDALVASQTSPVEVAGGATDWASVTAGFLHTCAVKTSGQLFCWGLDSAGQLGDDVVLAEKHTPVEVAGGATDWKSVAVGNSHTCALKTSGRLYCWGWDVKGALGDDVPFADEYTPVEVAGGHTDWTEVTAGGYQTCGRRATGPIWWTTGRLYCWGEDTYGGVGDGGTATDQPMPVEVVGTAGARGPIDAGLFHACARTRWERLWCWGTDGGGQLGDGGASPAVQTSPVRVVS